MAGSRRGFGTVERRTNRKTGKTTGYRARYLGPDMSTNSATFTAKRDAEAWLAAEERLIARGEWLPPRQRVAVQSITLSEYIEVNLPLRKLAPRSREEYEGYVRRFVTPDSLGATPLRAVTSTDIGEWLKRVRAATGPGMAARTYSFVSSMFNAAYRDQLVDRNPCTIRGASEAPRASAKTIATPEETAALMAAIPERYRTLILVAAWGGFRSGELRGLHRSDVDLDARQIRVRVQVQNLRGQGKVMRDVKTDAARRVVSLPPAVVAELARHMAKYAQPGPNGLVFPSRVGTPISQSVLWNKFNDARTSIGRPDLRLHDLRATAATMAARQGATLAELMARLGHTTPNAAMKYQTAVQAADERIAAALDAHVVLPGAVVKGEPGVPPAGTAKSHGQSGKSQA